MKREPVLVPPNPRTFTLYEHPPLDYFRYGEYPRDVVPPGAHGFPPTRWVPDPDEEPT